jgi:membrane protein YqaA with SNARE-associated domain
VTATLGTLAFSVLSALLPVFNVEVYLVAVATQIGPGLALPVALAAGAGQTVGKIVWYHGSARSMDLPWMRRRMASEKWQRRHARWRARLADRHWAGAGVTFASALVGLPPLLVMGAVAGALRMHQGLFVMSVFVGRSLQSYVILIGLVTFLH